MSSTASGFAAYPWRESALRPTEILLSDLLILLFFTSGCDFIPNLSVSCTVGVSVT